MKLAILPVLAGILAVVPAIAQTRAPEASLRQVAAATRAATVEPAAAGFVNGAQVYPYSEGTIFQAYAAPGLVTDIILQPGEMIFIPRGWWHHVRSLDKSISVSNIAYDAKGIVVDLLSERVKQILHDVGIYRVPCTCHIEHNGKRMRRSVAN